MSTIAIYARKSKFSQRSESVSTQVTLCREHCERLFPGSAFVIYDTDEGFSGKNTDRPGFQRLMEDIKSRRVDAVCVYRLDRISRSVSDFCQLLDLFRRYNIAFISLRENFDTSTPMGRAMIVISSAFSQLERETLAERVKDNIYELAKTGRWLGGQTPTGFDTASAPSVTNSQKRAVMLVPVESELSTVRQICALFMELGSLSKLYTHCLLHNIRSRNGIDFSRTTLRCLLTNPVYCTADADAYAYFSTHPCQLCADESDFDGIHGIMPFNRTSKDGPYTLSKSPDEWIISVGAHPGTIPGAQWVHIQDMLAQNKDLGKSFQSAPTETALLSGLMRCAHCGHPMRPKLYGKVQADGSRLFHYICTGKQETRGQLCTMANAPGHKVDDLVIAHLSSLAASSAFQPGSTVGDLFSESSTVTAEQSIQKHQAAIAAAQRKMDNLVDALAEGAPPQLRTRLFEQMEALQQEIDRTQQAIDDLTAALLNSQGQHSLAAHLQTLFAAFDDSFSSQTYDEKRRLIRSLVDSIIWDGENITINVLGASTLPK